ncbi:uncharacterized protein V6R79_000886, partial [Siganus canaliculatus]
VLKLTRCLSEERSDSPRAVCICTQEICRQEKKCSRAKRQDGEKSQDLFKNLPNGSQT